MSLLDRYQNIGLHLQSLMSQRQTYQKKYHPSRSMIINSVNSVSYFAFDHNNINNGNL